MPVGSIALLVVAVLIYFGVAHRVLDRMRLDDRTALAFVVAMIIGSFLNFTLLTRPVELLVNVGGGLVPIVLAVYLVVTADEAREKTRAVLAMLVTGAAVYGTAKILPPEPTQNFLIDPTFIFAAIAGITGYLAGRSRRSSFIAGSTGIVLADLAQLAELLFRGIPGRTWIGGAGAFDSVVLAGIIAVLLAELVGETREKLQGGARQPSGKGGEGSG